MIKLQFEKEVLGQYFSEHPTVSVKKNMSRTDSLYMECTSIDKRRKSKNSRLNTRNKTNSHEKRRINGLCYIAR